MPHPLMTTLTGIDGATDLNALIDLQRAHPQTEWGVLYCPKRIESLDDRYPSLERIRAIADRVASGHLTASIHLCGAAVPRFVAGDEAMLALTDSFDRIQLNMSVRRASFTPSELEAAIRRAHKPIITQWHAGNVAWLANGPVADNHQVLVDESGGQGMLPGYYPLPMTGFEGRTGYAGGLSADNLEGELPAILRAAGSGDEPVWVDMESSLRVKGLFSVELARRVLEVTGSAL